MKRRRKKSKSLPLLVPPRIAVLDLIILALVRICLVAGLLPPPPPVPLPEPAPLELRNTNDLETINRKVRNALCFKSPRIFLKLPEMKKIQPKHKKLLAKFLGMSSFLGLVKQIISLTLIKYYLFYLKHKYYTLYRNIF